MHTLGDYRLTHRLGVGGMGEVWKGRREALDGVALDVAIKVMSADRAREPQARQMFVDEARLSTLLHNSNIVRVFDVAETEDKTCYMVMEWVDGLNLAELNAKMRAAGQRLPDVIIAYVVGEVLKGLAHAHEFHRGGQVKTIVHRDISPHNVMLSVSGEVKVMDFGIARMASEDTSGAHVKGKLRYMPPEQLRGDTRAPTLDLFSVGALLHELLDGVKFRGKVVDEARLYGMILDGEVPPMDRDLDTIPPELDDIRRRLLAPRPKDRLQRAREAFIALTKWPQYRDARFELDDIVQRHTGGRSPVPALPPTQLLPHAKPAGDEAPSTPATLPTAAAAGSWTAHSVDSEAKKRRRPTKPPAIIARASKPGSSSPPEEDSYPSLLDSDDATTVYSESSDTDLTHPPHVVADSSERLALPSPWRSRALSIVLALFGLGSVAFGAWALIGRSDDGDDLQAPRLSKNRLNPPPTPSDQKQPVVPEPGKAPSTNYNQIVEGESNVEKVASGKSGTPEPGLNEGAVVSDDKPEPDTVEPQPTTKTKISLRLGQGVSWAELRIGGSIREIDAVSSSKVSMRLPIGRHRVSYRMLYGGPWKKAGRVNISENSTSLTLQKNGRVAVQ